LNRLGGAERLVEDVDLEAFNCIGMIFREDFERRLEMWNAVKKHIRAFFDSRGFVEVDVPLLVRSPGMEPNLDPFKVEMKRPDGGSDVAGFITSPEYAMKKILGMGVPKVYTMTKVFRNFEGGSWNTPEFTMLEWYGPGDYEDCMRETEELVNGLLGSRHVKSAGADHVASWPRVKYGDARVDAVGDPGVFDDYERFFLTEYPVGEASLAKLSSCGGYAERFEGYVKGVELCNGFSELLDSGEQRRRFEEEQEERRASGKDVFPIDEGLLASLDRIEGARYGNALGVDRLLMLAYGVSDIRDIHYFDF